MPVTYKKPPIISDSLPIEAILAKFATLNGDKWEITTAGFAAAAKELGMHRNLVFKDIVQGSEQFTDYAMLFKQSLTK